MHQGSRSGEVSTPIIDNKIGRKKRKEIKARPYPIVFSPPLLASVISDFEINVWIVGLQMNVEQLSVERETFQIHRYADGGVVTESTRYNVILR
jgi:hypothetical protein